MCKIKKKAISSYEYLMFLFALHKKYIKNYFFFRRKKTFTMCYWQMSTRNGYINVPTNSAVSVLDLHRIQNLLLEELILVSRFCTMTRGALRNLTSSGFCATSHPGNSPTKPEWGSSRPLLCRFEENVWTSVSRVLHTCFPLLVCQCVRYSMHFCVLGVFG